MAAAGGALSTYDLAELAGTEFETIEPFVTGRAQRSLRASGDADEARYGFRHRALQETCREHTAVGDIRYWRKIADWADTWAAKGWPPPGRSPDGSRGTPKYLLENYPGALVGATDTPPRLPDDYQRLAALVSDRKWSAALWPPSEPIMYSVLRPQPPDYFQKILLSPQLYEWCNVCRSACWTGRQNSRS